MDYEETLMIKTTWCYYIENMTQQAIAEQLGISRMRVIKLLEKARIKKVIQFKIRSDAAHRMELEKQLLDRYGLKDIYIVPSVSENINETVARAAALYIGDHVQNKAFINIGFGDTTSRTLNNLILASDSEISLVSLTGGVSYYTSSANCGVASATRYIIPAPFIASTAEMASAICEESSVSEILRLANLASLTVVGIGGVTEHATVVKDGKLTANDLLIMQMKGAVGDILGHFIDKNGDPIDCPIHNRLISTPLEALKTFPNVVGVAGGLEKTHAINAALKSGCLDVLITDEETAESLLTL
ncbi:sugar-binding transcriptional regulator [Hydrogenoanaerobacterium sp.]|uniref:sugar-binding transcriptional regulator n=1 Tax=Hydrogenoanaerobacterium sp. TaxID=2953763 RepID=UPI0028A0919C|nr:sugar-binding transcriptional regulator [Hydrogenoanaerobacterium sp.]